MPATDRDGNARTGTPDAGAYESAARRALAADPDPDAHAVAAAHSDADSVAHSDAVAVAVAGQPGTVGAAGHGVVDDHAEQHRRPLGRVVGQPRRDRLPPVPQRHARRHHDQHELLRQRPAVRDELHDRADRR